MSRTSNTFAGVLVALFVAGGAATAIAQTANGNGGGSNAGGNGGGATTMPAAYSAVVPNNTHRQTAQRFEPGGDSCATPTEGIRGPRLMRSCGPR